MKDCHFGRVLFCIVEARDLLNLQILWQIHWLSFASRSAAPGVAVAARRAHCRSRQLPYTGPMKHSSCMKQSKSTNQPLRQLQHPLFVKDAFVDVVLSASLQNRSCLVGAGAGIAQSARKKRDARRMANIDTNVGPFNVPWTFEMVFHVKETLQEYTKRMAADQSVAVSWPCHLSCFESALGGVLGCAGSLKWNAFKGILWWQLLQGLTFIFPPERTEGITSLYRLYRLNVTKHTLVCCTAPVSSLHFGAVACKTFPWRRLHWSMEYCDFFIMAKIPCLCTSLLVRSVVFWAFWRAGWNWLNEQCHGGPFSLCCLWRPCGLYKKILFPLVAPSTHW